MPFGVVKGHFEGLKVLFVDLYDSRSDYIRSQLSSEYA
jgi:hypothetical protein